MYRGYYDSRADIDAVSIDTTYNELLIFIDKTLSIQEFSLLTAILIKSGK